MRNAERVQIVQSLDQAIEIQTIAKLNSTQGWRLVHGRVIHGHILSMTGLARAQFAPGQQVG